MFSKTAFGHSVTCLSAESHQEESKQQKQSTFIRPRFNPVGADGTLCCSQMSTNLVMRVNIYKESLYLYQEC